MIAQGRYFQGCGKAHVANRVHEAYFDCPMYGTFNVRANLDIQRFKPTIGSNGDVYRYWHLRIDGRYDGWAWRRAGSKMSNTVLEIVSKVPLPDELKHKKFTVEVIEGP